MCFLAHHPFGNDVTEDSSNVVAFFDIFQSVAVNLAQFRLLWRSEELVPCSRIVVTDAVDICLYQVIKSAEVAIPILILGGLFEKLSVATTQRLMDFNALLEKGTADCFLDVGLGKSKVIKPINKFFIFAVV
jgi:hypothetical protein